MSKASTLKLLSIVLWLSSQSVLAVSDEKEQQAIIDQTVKLKTLAVVKDANQLIEDVGYPQTSRFKLYMSHGLGKYFILEKVSVVIDGDDRSEFEYTEIQSKSLLRGGSNRIYIGSVSEGIHELVVVFEGKDRLKNIIKKAETFLFDKKPGEMIVVIKIKDNEESLRPGFEFITIKGSQ